MLENSRLHSEKSKATEGFGSVQVDDFWHGSDATTTKKQERVRWTAALFTHSWGRLAVKSKQPWLGYCCVTTWGQQFNRCFSAHFACRRLQPTWLFKCGPQKALACGILYAELTTVGCSDERGKLHWFRARSMTQKKWPRNDPEGIRQRGSHDPSVSQSIL